MTLPTAPQQIAEHLHTQLRLWRSEQDVALPGIACAQLAGYLTPLIVQYRDEALAEMIASKRDAAEFTNRGMSVVGRTATLPPVADDTPERDDPTP